MGKLEDAEKEFAKDYKSPKEDIIIRTDNPDDAFGDFMLMGRDTDNMTNKEVENLKLEYNNWFKKIRKVIDKDLYTNKQ